MSLLLSVLFPLLVAIYVLFVHKNDYSLSPLVSGVLAGVCVLPLAILLKFGNYTSPNLLAYSFSYFLFYFLLPSIFGLILYFLANLKAFDVQTMPCALSGIWTVFFVFAVYDFSRGPEVAIYIIFLLSYSVSILFYDILVMLFRTLPKILVFLLSYPLTLIFAYLSTLSFASWLYKQASLIYIGIPSILLVVFLSLAILLAYRKKDSKIYRNKYAKKQTIADIFAENNEETYKGTSI